MVARTYEHILREAEKLSREDQLQLIEQLVSRLRTLSTPPSKPLCWEELAGAATYPLCGEDAQAWVTRHRQDSDAGRSAP